MTYIVQNNIFFIGIGGIGMSALARYMHHIGKKVAGYDRTSSIITEELQKLGIPLFFKDDTNAVPPDFSDKKNTLIVYTPAVKQSENALLDYFISNKFKVIKRAELLADITKNSICLAVAGTHGKTSTSSLLGHILKEAGVPATSFLGGIAENYASNLILGGKKYTVVEADEFDRSFLQLRPDIACITSIDADHLDIYKKPSHLIEAFREFADLTTQKLFVKKGIPIEGTTYGIDENADYEASNIRWKEGMTFFDVKTPEETYKNLKVSLPGKYNVINTVAALAMANSIGVPLQAIAKALLSYKGVHRRFSYRLQTKERILIDDYAHHPTEIKALYDAVSDLYPEDKVLIVFQPHLYSRTRDFEEGFVQCLAAFDDVLLLPIYPAREHPLPGITSNALVEKIKVLNPDVKKINPDEIVTHIKASENKIVLMVGAGDIGEMVINVQRQLSV